jgi:hypothetical protein
MGGTHLIRLKTFPKLLVRRTPFPAQFPAAIAVAHASPGLAASNADDRTE